MTADGPTRLALKFNVPLIPITGRRIKGTHFVSTAYPRDRTRLRQARRRTNRAYDGVTAREPVPRSARARGARPMVLVAPPLAEERLGRSRCDVSPLPFHRFEITSATGAASRIGRAIAAQGRAEARFAHALAQQRQRSPLRRQSAATTASKIRRVLGYNNPVRAARDRHRARRRCWIANRE